MSIVLTKNSKLSSVRLYQIVKLIESGGEIKTTRTKLLESLLRSDLITYDLEEDLVICTATLKNPQTLYREKVFSLAKVNGSKNYDKELGYIATHRDFEGRGHCQKLLQHFLPHMAGQKVYATTRNPIMAHILGKSQFAERGQTYNGGLRLMIYEGR